MTASTDNVVTASTDDAEGDSMNIIAFITSKGGSGKSTLAASMAVAAARDGETVLAVDIDPQATLSSWGKRRSSPDGVDTVQTQAADLAGVLEQARQSGRYSLVIIDTPGLSGPEIAIAAKEVDFALIPLQPSINDLEAADRTAAAMKRLQKRCAFIVNRCRPSSPGRVIDLGKALVPLGIPLAPQYVTDLADFLDAMTAGQGVSEFKKKSKGAQQIEFLWVWVKQALKVGNDGTKQAA
jgi:chromosome partitioning protein